MINTNKRSVIHAERLAILKQSNAVYTICCHHDEYFCASHDEGCWRGFFSLYLQVIHGIAFARRMGLPYYVDFGNLQYRYSDEKYFNGDRNFWNYYFEQALITNSSVQIINVRNENYPLRIWSKIFIQKLHDQAVTQLTLKSEIQQSVNQIKSSYSGLKVLGIHIRRTDHFHEVRHAPISSYFKAANRKIKNYDKIFVATDDEAILKDFIAYYPEKVIYNSASRSSGGLAVHSDMKKTDRFQLGKEALLECYSLALCDSVILSPSNLSYAALLINPTLDYELVESWPAKWKRWKTLIVFYLDHWNIRKW